MFPTGSRTQPAAGSSGRAQSFLAALVRDERPIDARDVCIVIAHPDDETIGCGAQLGRLRRATLVVLTDGSPADGLDAARIGDTREAYALRRRRELSSALDAGCADVDVLWLAVRDQTAAYLMTDLAHRVARELRLRRTNVVLTHAYEGGHPDHDAGACIVHLVAADIRRTHPDSTPAVIEMPYYRSRAGEMSKQSFWMDVPEATTEIPLSRSAMDRKIGMIAAYVSQAPTLRQFDTTRERFRIAPEYDFAQPPNGGDLLYERFGWGEMSRSRWTTLVRQTRDALGI